MFSLFCYYRPHHLALSFISILVSTQPNMTNTPAPEHRIPRYHAFSTPEEQEAYIDLTDSVDTLNSAAPPSPTLTEISLLHQVINPKPWRDIEPNESPHEPSSLPGPKRDISGRLTAMLTLYDLAMSCEEIEEADWDEYITPYEPDDLEMLERRFPGECWPPEIEASWPNLVVYARWKKLSQDSKSIVEHS
jgi:hypothetical protein